MRSLYSRPIPLSGGAAPAETRGRRPAGRHLWLAGLLLAAAACAPEGGTPHPVTGREKVLIVTVDTLRADYLGSAGSHLPTTPFIDSLMREGYRFTRAVTPIPRTTQALASLLTGCYPHTTQVRTLYDRMAPGIVSVAELAREKGYATLAVVSNHILIPDRGLDRGFDLYDFADDARDASQTTLAAIGHLIERREEKALFVWVHYIDPHVPYFPPADIAAAFDPGYEGPYKHHFGTVKGGTGDAAYPEDLPKEVAVYRNPLPARVNEHLRRLYAAEVRFNDDQIAVLVNWVRREMGDDWLILFTSDHGESLGEHDYYYDHGEYVYEASLRVPLVIVLPPGDPLRGSGTIDDRVSLVDIMPTLAELLDLPLPDDPAPAIEGRSLVPHLRGESPAPRPLFAESGQSFFPHLVRGRERFDVEGRFRAVVSGDWKLIWAPGTGGSATTELYHLTEDPNEERNEYAEDHPEARRLMAHLRDWLRPARRPDVGPTPEDLERLRSLGYVDASAEPGSETGSDEQ